MISTTQDILNIRRSLAVEGKNIDYFSLPAAQEAGLGQIDKLPFSLKILIENLLRHEDGERVQIAHIVMAIQSIIDSMNSDYVPMEVAFRPARVLMQDFTGVPAIVDLAAMRDAMDDMHGDISLINPLVPVDLVIDHSVMVDEHGTANAFYHNVQKEFQRNAERYAFLKWGQKAFRNFRVVPPGTGICHQVNLEYLAQIVWIAQDSAGRLVAYPDTVLGTDSHTTMINGLSVLGWGVGGIEAEAAMLGQPVSMLVPRVAGFKLTGRLPEGSTATDLVLTITNILRKRGVVGKFVEFYGDGLDFLGLADRATIANMAPEYGATCGFFPVDYETLRYLHLTGREASHIHLVEAYARVQGLWRDASTPDPVFPETFVLNLADVRPAIAGPRRPQDIVLLDKAKETCQASLQAENKIPSESFTVFPGDYSLHHGDIVIAAITSCTNTSNPAVMVAAGLLAANARQKGLQVKPWVKTSLAPGSQVVTDYLDKSGLTKDLNALGFNLVGYGCTTCIGNSGLLESKIAQSIETHDLTVCAILSGNRNFEGRINSHVKANYLASPPLVIAYALAGTMLIDLTTEPLGSGLDGTPVYLKDIWPSSADISKTINQCLTPDMFRQRYANVFRGEDAWQKINAEPTSTYAWQEKSTYIKNPPYFRESSIRGANAGDIRNARILAILGDSITTDHISPAGNIAEDSPAGRYLREHNVEPANFNSYGARRGNHEIMMRGTFANIRLINELAPDTRGGLTRYFGDDRSEIISIYEAAMKYQSRKIPLVVIAGKEYGTGSSRDWAAKGPLLLGVKAVIAESFERIHRSNLLGMGILPLTFINGQNRHSLSITGEEIIDITGIDNNLQPGMILGAAMTRPDKTVAAFSVRCRIDTCDEINYFLNGGILPFVLHSLLAKSSQQ